MRPDVTVSLHVNNSATIGQRVVSQYRDFGMVAYIGETANGEMVRYGLCITLVHPLIAKNYHGRVVVRPFLPLLPNHCLPSVSAAPRGRVCDAV